MTINRLGDPEFAIMAEMRERRKTYAVIARKLKCSSGMVYWHCLRLGIDPYPTPLRAVPTEPVIVKRGKFIVRRFTQDEDNRLLSMSISGMKEFHIAKALNRGTNSIRGRLMTLARRDARMEAAEHTDL